MEERDEGGRWKSKVEERGEKRRWRRKMREGDGGEK